MHSQITLSRILTMCLLFLPLSAFPQTSSHKGAPKYSPENGQKLLIIGQDLGAVGGLNNYAEGYVDHLMQIPAGVTSYTGLPNLTGLTAKANWGAGDVNASEYISDETFDHSCIIIGFHIVDQLGNIIAGNSDSKLEILGNWIKAQERPVFLRIGYEFDGSWNHYDPTQFKAAWKYIVHLFDDMKIQNIAYVWQSAGINTSNIGQWYPGDEYVNWLGYSHFDITNPGQSILNFAKEHDKPIMIAEATPRVDLKTGNANTHWNNWYAPLFSKIYDNEQIKALAYINVNWDSQSMWTGQGWGDSRVQINDTIKQNWLTETSKDSWILASDSLFQILDYAKWQDSLYVPVIELQSLPQALIYSNSNSLIIKSENNIEWEQIQIFDISGRILFRNNCLNTSYRIPLYLLPKNTTIIVYLKKGKKQISQKIII